MIFGRSRAIPGLLLTELEAARHDRPERGPIGPNGLHPRIELGELEATRPVAEGVLKTVAEGDPHELTTVVVAAWIANKRPCVGHKGLTSRSVLVETKATHPYGKRVWYVKASDGPSVVSAAIVIATGVAADGPPRGARPGGR
jgi:hypothetical protein